MVQHAHHKDTVAGRHVVDDMRTVLEATESASELFGASADVGIRGEV